jgi:pSer/pThr/pTyr-binding forkhead associated (FHA) protein
MSSPQFPVTAALLEAQPCPPAEFDALFAKLTREPDAATGYFLRTHPADARVLFVFNGVPYASGRVAGIDCTLEEIHEFFADYAERPEAPLSFFSADKRLLLGLMVLFAHRPSLTFRSDLVQIEEILEVLAEKQIDQILAFRSSESWAIAIAVKGRVAYFFPPVGTEPLAGTTPVEQCLAFFQARQTAGVVVELYEETRVKRAGDALLITPENRGELSAVFLEAAQRAHEAEPLDATEEPAPAADLVPVDAMEVDHGEADGAPPSREDSPEAIALFKGHPPDLLLYLGDKQLGSFSLTGGELKIGRSPENHVVIENSGVSRRHAVVRIKDGRVVLEDLGSANGTFVRGRKVDSYLLQDGDEFVIVKHRLVYRVPKTSAPVVQRDFLEQTTICIDPAAVSQVAAGPGPSARPDPATLRPRLVFPDRKRFDLEGDEVTLGSAPSCHIQITGMFVGKVHARIVQTPDGFKIQHASGMAGTKVNGMKILEHTLKHGDEIQIGKQKLLFRAER